LKTVGIVVAYVRMFRQTVRVLHWLNLVVVVEVVEERSEDLPGCVKFVVTDKVAVVALEGIEDKGLVGLGDLEVGETAAVCEVELGHDSLHAETGLLGVHLDVDGLVGLNTDDDFVAGNVLEDARGDVLRII